MSRVKPLEFTGPNPPYTAWSEQASKHQDKLSIVLPADSNNEAESPDKPSGEPSFSQSSCMSVEEDIVNFYTDRSAAVRFGTWIKSPRGKLYIDRCCIRTVEDRYLCTPFQAAVIQYQFHQRFELLDLLLDADANINSVEVTTGCTAIVMASRAKVGDPKLIHYLLECGANPLIADHQGLNALSCARSYKIFPLFVPYYQDAAVLDLMMLRNRKENFAKTAYTSFARSRRMSLRGPFVPTSTSHKQLGLDVEFQPPSGNRSKRSWVSLIPVEPVRAIFSHLVAMFDNKTATTKQKKYRSDYKFIKESSISLKHPDIDDPIEINVQSTQKFSKREERRLLHSTQTCDIRVLGREVHFAVEVDHRTFVVQHKFEPRVKTTIESLMAQLGLDDEDDFVPFLSFLLSYVDVNYSRKTDLTRFDVILPLILRNDMVKGPPLRYHWFPGVVRSWLWNPGERERVFDWMSWHRKL